MCDITGGSVHPCVTSQLGESPPCVFTWGVPGGFQMAGSYPVLSLLLPLLMDLLLCGGEPPLQTVQLFVQRLLGRSQSHPLNT